MVWLDFVLIGLICIVFCAGIGFCFIAYNENEGGTCFKCFIGTLIMVGMMICIFFLHMDKKSGYTQGRITSVDKNFFGTTALYVKTTETSEEKYCIEDDELAKFSEELIGKDVKIHYGTRVGLYSVSKCGDSPVDKIEVIKDE